jgi:hypothetical protein
MNRAQRKAHARTWPFLALVLLAIIGAAVTVKQRVIGVSAAAHEWAAR